MGLHPRRLPWTIAGPKDLMDVTELLEVHPELARDTLAAAEAYSVGEALAGWTVHRRPRPGAGKRKK